jgi:hypothetical protein
MAGSCVLKSLFLYRFVRIVHSVHPYYAGYCALSEVNVALVVFLKKLVLIKNDNPIRNSNIMHTEPKGIKPKTRPQVNNWCKLARGVKAMHMLPPNILTSSA